MSKAITFLLTYKQALAESFAELMHDKTNYVNIGAFISMGLWKYFSFMMDELVKYDAHITAMVGISVILYNCVKMSAIVFDKAKEYFKNRKN